MGVDYNPVFAIGKEFETVSECVEFLNEHGVLTEEQQHELEEEGDSYITEIAGPGDLELDVENLNAYSGYGYYVGISLNPRNISALSDSVAEALNLWARKFPNVEADIIHTVRIS